MNTVWNNVELALPSIWYRNRKIQFENGIKWIRYASWIGFNTALCIYTLTRYHFKRRVQISRYKYIPHFMLVHKSWSLCTILLANSFLPTFTDTRRMNILCTSENHEIFSSCFSENDSEIELRQFSILDKTHWALFHHSNQSKFGLIVFTFHRVQS